MDDHVVGEETLVIQKNLFIKNKPGSVNTGPTGGYVEIFFNSDNSCLSYGNQSIGIIPIENTTGPTGSIGPTGPTGPSASIGQNNIFSLSFNKNDSTEYIKTRTPRDIAARFIYEGVNTQSLSKLSIIAATSHGTTEATFDITDSYAKTVYCSETVELTETPTIFNITSFSNLPTSQSLLLFRYGPTSGKSYVNMFFASLS